MRIWRLEFGVILYEGKPLKLEDRIYRLEYEPGICGCHIFSFGKYYLTLLGDECYYETLKGESDETRE